VLLDPGTTWQLDADQGMIFVVDIHYYDDEQDLEDEDIDYDAEGDEGDEAEEGGDGHDGHPVRD
jgi:hypothetical protein